MALLVGQPVAVEGAALVVLLFHLHLVQRAEACLLVVWRWRARRRAGGVRGQGLLQGLLHERLQVGGCAGGLRRRRGLRCRLRLGRLRGFARGGPLGGALFAGFDDFL